MMGALSDIGERSGVSKLRNTLKRECISLLRGRLGLLLYSIGNDRARACSPLIPEAWKSSSVVESTTR